MFGANIDARIEYTPGDPVLIKNIVSQLKSQGVFDQFRKECISDVDTKPAYQNLCHRVDGRVAAYLSDTKWGPSLNKNQLRENIRKHVNECTFVDSGIARIVDQLVNPRINTVLVPKVEDIVYTYLGIERPENDQFRNNLSVSKKTNVLARNGGGYEEKSQSDIPLENERVMSSLSQQPELSSIRNLFPDFKNGIEQKPTMASSARPIDLHGMNACSDIDSDEDDMSPPFEPHEKSDVELSAESDYSMDVSDTKYEVKSEPSVTIKADIDCPRLESSPTRKPDTDCDKIFRNLERICGEESMDSATSSCTDKISSRKPSLSLDLPNTPTVNYETSDESQDNQSKKNLRLDSVQNEICPPDTSSMDSFMEKGLESNEVSPNNVVDDSGSAAKTKNDDVKEPEDADPSKSKKSETKSRDSKDSRRDHKSSSSRRDKDHKSSRDHKSSKDRDKDRSSHESKSTRDRKEHSKDGDRSRHSEKSSKENDSKRRESSKVSSSGDKNRSSSSRPRSDDSKDDRKKKSSSSKPDSEKDRERSKHRKEESSEVKKSKTQCSSDKKTRNDRRSSDRDSSGPSSSSNSSSQRSSSKTDKEKHRHSSSSSSSSSHKTKKNVETKENDRTVDALFDSMLSVTGSTVSSSNAIVIAKGTNIENTSSLLDILNDCSEIDTSRGNSTSKESQKVSVAGSSGGKKDEYARSKENKKKTDQSKFPKPNSTSRKNSVHNNGALKVDVPDPDAKKPKIARNAADILRIIELRKQYEHKSETEHSSVDSSTENIRSEKRKESSDENTQKSVGDSYRSEEIAQNEENDPAFDSVGDCKLKIKRVDSRYRLVNGSCTLQHLQNSTLIASNDVNADDCNANDRIQDLRLNALTQPREGKFNGSLDEPTNLKKNVDAKTRGCDVMPTVLKSCMLEESDEVHYFEPAEPNTDFINFVAKRVREYEEICLENFSIHIKCAERYDHIFRSQLGAIVKRKYDPKSSPFKYNSEIIDSKIGNEKGIMMRIKKTVPEGEMSTLPCEMNYFNGLQPEAVGEFRDTFSTTISANSNKSASAKRKTLGMKRRLSNTGKVPSSKVAKPNQTSDLNGAIDPKYLSTVVPGSEIADNERIDGGSRESFDDSETSRASTLSSPRSLSSVTHSVHSSGPPAPKIPKVISKEQKRKQFYYDANDLYKPRPSFLLSSRRSRGLDPNNT